MQKQKDNWIWIIGAFYFNVMDALLTVLGVSRLGAKELNPIMSYFLRTNVLAFLLFKISLGLAIIAWCAKRGRISVLKYITILFGAVVFWNIVQLLLAGLKVL